MKQCRIAVFADMDGTVLDKNYSYHAVKPYVEKLQENGFCLIFCSSKTRAEIEYYRQTLGVDDPFVSENGAAIFIPKGYFSKNNFFTCKKGNYEVVELGVPYSVIRKGFERIKKKTGFALTGFGDLTAEEIAKTTGLPKEFALLARQREYSEPFNGEILDEKVLFDAADAEQLRCVKGDRYYHLMGMHDKGAAVTILRDFFVETCGSLKFVGVGNGPNDLSMLKVVDYPFFVGATESLDSLWQRLWGKVEAIMHQW
ncbi:MAG: HAD-IIB family hydrolase [Candidatus Bathyarchaeota archaeon]|nr:HAD-IIB family hydrolase [Candidatus Bathyarchaeota archaeon]